MLKAIIGKIRKRPPDGGRRQSGGGGRRRLTAAQVREIRRRAADESQSALAREFGISQPAVYQIVRRESYKDVE